MSFGFSVGDITSLIHLAWSVVKKTREASGDHAAILTECESLHIALQNLHLEVSEPESILNRDNGNALNELKILLRPCKQLLKSLRKALKKYTHLPANEQSFARLVEQVKFGHGTMQTLGGIRQELSTHISMINMFLHGVSRISLGRIERGMETQGHALAEIRMEIIRIVARAVNTHDGSDWTVRSMDDEKWWRGLRKELVDQKCNSRVLDKHRKSIKCFVKELGKQGVLDDPVEQDEPETDSDHILQGEGSQFNTASLEGNFALADPSIAESDHVLQEEGFQTDSDSSEANYDLSNSPMSASESALETSIEMEAQTKRISHEETLPEDPTPAEVDTNSIESAPIPGFERDALQNEAERDEEHEEVEHEEVEHEEVEHEEAEHVEAEETEPERVEPEQVKPKPPKADLEEQDLTGTEQVEIEEDEARSTLPPDHQIPVQQIASTTPLPDVSWPDLLVEAMERPIKLSYLVEIFRDWGVPKKHMSHWTVLLSRIAAARFSTGGLILMEDEEEWTFWADTDEYLNEWANPYTYWPYSIDLELLREENADEFRPPSSRMIMEGEQGGMLFGRAFSFPAPQEQRKRYELELRLLIKRYKFQELKESIKNGTAKECARKSGFLVEPN